MTGIDGYNWGSVGWTNPIPGDPDVVRGIGGQFADLADEASQQNSLLQSVGSDASGVWKGGAADAFHPTVAKLPGQLDKLVTSYRDAGNALNTFWPKHRAAQQLAVQALAKAQAAQSAITHAKAQVASAQSSSDSAATAYNQAVNPPGVPGHPNPKPAPAASQANLLAQYRSAQGNLQGAQSSLSAANGDMKAATDMRDTAVANFEAAAKEFVSIIGAASSAGIQNPHSSFFGSLLGDAEDIGKGLVDVYHWAQKDVLPVLKVADTVLSDVSMVVGVVALVLAPIPGVDAISAGLELVNEGLMVAKTGVDAGELALGDTDAVSELAVDGIGLATMGVSNLLGDGAEEGENLANKAVSQAASNGEKAAGDTAEATTTATTDAATTTEATTTSATTTEATTTSAATAAPTEDAAGATPATTSTEATSSDEAATAEPTSASSTSGDPAPDEEPAAPTGSSTTPDEEATTPASESSTPAPDEEPAPAQTTSATSEDTPAADQPATETSQPASSPSEPEATTSSDPASQPEAQPTEPEAQPDAPVAHDAPSSDAPSSDAPSSDAPVAHDAPSSDAPAAHDAPSSDAPAAHDTPSSEPSSSEPDLPAPPHPEPSGDLPAPAHTPTSEDLPAPAHTPTSEDLPASHVDTPSSEPAPAHASTDSSSSGEAHEGAGTHEAHGGQGEHAGSEKEPIGFKRFIKNEKVAKALGQDKFEEINKAEKLYGTDGVKAGFKVTAEKSLQGARQDFQNAARTGGIKGVLKLYNQDIAHSWSEETGVLRKMLWIKEHVETPMGVVNFGDQMVTGHGLNPIHRQETGQDTLKQLYDKTQPKDPDDPDGPEPPMWLTASGAFTGLG